MCLYLTWQILHICVFSISNWSVFPPSTCRFHTQTRPPETQKGQNQPTRSFFLSAKNYVLCKQTSLLGHPHSPSLLFSGPIHYSSAAIFTFVLSFSTTLALLLLFSLSSVLIFLWVGAPACSAPDPAPRQKTPSSRCYPVIIKSRGNRNSLRPIP